MARFLDDVGHPAVKANLDISHLALANSAAERDSPRLEGRMAHVHFSDCDGKVHGDLPPGRGVVDFPPYLEQYAAGFDGDGQHRAGVFARTRQDRRLGARGVRRNRRLMRRAGIERARTIDAVAV